MTSAASDEDLIVRGGPRPSLLSKLLNVIKGILLKFKSLLTGRGYHLDDLIHIFRPFIYVALVTKYGTKDYLPIKISFTLDMVAMVVSLTRLIKSASSKTLAQNRLHSFEKRTLMRRIWYQLLKYLIRDPIYQSHTQPLLMKIFQTLRIPVRIYSILFALVEYCRYYSYIA